MEFRSLETLRNGIAELDLTYTSQDDGYPISLKEINSNI